MNFALSIPTYKRPSLLRLLIQDVAMQSCRPSLIVIVDGDPVSGDVLAILKELKFLCDWEIRYVASNHPNLSYQRYLGYLAAKDHDFLVYLDDDLRMTDANAFSKLLSPLINPDSVFVAGTSVIRFPQELGAIDGAVRNRIHDSRQATSLLVKWFGASARTAAGGMTPLGNRILPVLSGVAYSEVEWLRGGVMAFRVKILSEKFFSDDLFALTHVRCGLGEDTFLGRRALAYGKLFMANECVIDHPNADEPKAYPTQAFRMGLATAYSRRFINDTYRGFKPTTFADRKALIKGLLGGTVLVILRAMRSPSGHRFAYATGYVYGALRAFFTPPTARRLTPDIDWRNEARSAIGKIESI